MKKGHTPLGYRIVDGRAIIDEADAQQVKLIFRSYLDGLSMRNAAKSAGLTLTHGSVKHILCNRHYIGDEFYPAIIDRETFDAAESERQRREKVLGRDSLPKKKPETRTPPVGFRMIKATQAFAEPYRRAEYLYSLIESEE